MSHSTFKKILATTSLALFGASAFAGPITTDELAMIEPGMSMDQVAAIAGKGREVQLLGNDGPTFKYTQVADPLSYNTGDVYITYGSDGLVKGVQVNEHLHD